MTGMLNFLIVYKVSIRDRSRVQISRCLVVMVTVGVARITFKIHQTPVTEAETVTSRFGKWLLDAVQDDTKHRMPSCTVCIILHLFVSL